MKRITTLVLLLLTGFFNLLVVAQSDLVESLDPFIMYAQPSYSNEDGLKHNDPTYQNHPDFGKLTFDAPYNRNVVEVLSKRTLDERYYVDLNDQTFFYIEKSNRPINFYEGEILRAIDPTLHKVNDQYYQSGAQPVPTALDLMNKRALLKIGNDYLGMSHVHLEMTDFSGEVTSIEADWSTAVVGNAGAYIENIFPGIDMKIVFREAGFKTEYILKYNLGVKEIRIVDEMNLPDKYNVLMDGDSLTSLFVQLYNTETGETDVVIDPARLKDNSGSRTSWLCPYTIYGNSVSLLCDSLLLNGSDKIYPLTIDPLFTAVGPITSAFGIRGSLLTPASCNNSLNVTFPGGSTPWDVSANWTVVTDFCARTLLLFGFYDDCYMSDAQVWLTSSCGGASPVGAPGTIWTCLGCNTIGTWAPTLPFASSGTQSLAQCYSPSCSNQTLTFTMFDNRSYCTSYSVYDNCNWANSYCVSLDQWSVTVQGRTLETLGNTVTGNGSTTINDGDCLGTALLDPTPLYGVAPYTYSWSTGATSSTITVGVTPAVYTCTVTTACGSSVVATFNIGCPLSASLNSFNAELISDYVQLSWQTSPENDIAHFIVERAGSDGVFESIANVESAGTNNGFIYQFKDDNPLSGVNYYRLNTIYSTGDSELSDIKSVYIASEEIAIVPNPASENFTISFDRDHEKILFLTIINATGEVVFQKEILSEEEVITETIDAKEFPAGVYTIQLNGNTIRKSRLVIY